MIRLRTVLAALLAVGLASGPAAAASGRANDEHTKRRLMELFGG